MLEIKNLVKKYKAKGGVTVTALNSVSLKFPETGMIFLLGKSGSGKSTLLNVVGGLDRPDSGEIIIKGKNSKSFSAADFDSYRNTYIGFIFQEYNILNEFNVEQNISLALQLQGKPNDKKTVEALLEQVDLKGYGKRKPNTLSGGQKQRVAIARALIKSPEIIMADEPTGALDSNTGKQVFDTLKKLSQEKLVIVVSHDRDFAETYGDRIIELSDGKVVSDVSKEFIEPVYIGDNIQVVNDHTLSIKDASKLKKGDMDAIYDILKKQNGQAIISSGEHDIGVVKQAIHLSDDSGSAVFNDTTEVNTKEYDPKKTKFIRSHLPIARAFRMGASSLKTKPVRLVFTSFLTIVSLTMFGLTSTLMLFDENYSVSKAMQQSERASEMVQKEYYYHTVTKRVNNKTGEIEDGDSYSQTSNRTMLSQEDVDSLNHNNENMKFVGVYAFGDRYNQATFYNETFSSAPRAYYQIINPQGFVEINQKVMSEQNLTLINGTLPTNKDEVVISEYFFNLFKDSYEDISNYQDIIDRDIVVSFNDNKGMTTKLSYKIKGILNAGSIPSKYDDLKENNNDKLSNEQITKLSEQLNDYLNFSFQTCLYVSSDFYQEIYYPIAGNNDPFSYYSNNYPYVYTDGLVIQAYTPFDSKEDISSYTVGCFSYETIKNLPHDDVKFYDTNGNQKALENMAENDVYIPEDEYRSFEMNGMFAYLEKYYHVLENTSCDPELNDYMFTHREQCEELGLRLREYYFAKEYKEGYSREDDVAFAKSMIEQYYVKTQKIRYTMDIASAYRYAYESRGLPIYPEFEQFAQNVDSVYQGNPTWDLTNLDAIKQFLVQDRDGFAKLAIIMEKIQNVWSDVCEEFRNKYYMDEDIDESLIQQVVNYIRASDKSFTTTFTDDIFVATYEPPKIYYTSYTGNTGTLDIAGYYSTPWGGGPYILTLSFLNKNGNVQEYSWYSEMVTSYVRSGTPRYVGALTRSNYSQRQIAVLRQHTSSFGYFFSNSTYDNMVTVLWLIGLLKTIFLILGIVFGVFAALMLLNFISTSIASKTKDIGVLRAVGARGSDLFKIFFSESGLVTFICLVLAIAGSVVACFFLNSYMVAEVGIMMLNFNIVNVGIMVGGAAAIAFIGTFLPVLLAALRPPVESIRTL